MMIGEEKSSDGGFTINVNSPGNFIAKEITFTGPVNIGGSTEQGGYTDEQIAEAIIAINGTGKILNSKQKWAGVYWCLRWYCNYPSNVTDFCEKVKDLSLSELEYPCDQNNFRRIASMSFMNENPRYMDKIKPSNSEKEYFIQCREVVFALLTELGKAVLPKVKI